MLCHQIDTWRAVPNKVSQSIHKADDRHRSLLTMPRMDQCKTGTINGWAPPPLCLPSVYLTSLHVTRSPRLSPAVFHTGSNQTLMWERSGNEATGSILSNSDDM